MKIINYNESFDKEKILNDVYKMCIRASFPVTKDDVYDHLFGNDSSLKLLVDDNSIKGFGVFNEYSVELQEKLIKMLYLAGMVVDIDYQGYGISKKIILDACQNYELVSLRTQNIKMAKSLIRISENVLIPNNNEFIKYFESLEPFRDINNNGVIRDCYYEQLYPDLTKINDYFNVDLNSYDALGVIVKRKVKK